MPITKCSDCGVEISYCKIDPAPKLCYKCKAKSKTKAAQGAVKEITQTEDQEDKKYFKQSGYESRKNKKLRTTDNV